MRFVDICDYVMLFGFLGLIPTGLDGDLIMPWWASLCIIGAGATGRIYSAALDVLKK